MGEMRAKIQHRLNPLHVYCRLVDRGLGRRFSSRLCWYYEKLLYRRLNTVAAISVTFLKLARESFSVEMNDDPALTRFFIL